MYKQVREDLTGTPESIIHFSYRTLATCPAGTQRSRGWRRASPAAVGGQSDESPRWPRRQLGASGLASLAPVPFCELSPTWWREPPRLLDGKGGAGGALLGQEGKGVVWQEVREGPRETPASGAGGGS